MTTKPVIEAVAIIITTEIYTTRINNEWKDDISENEYTRHFRGFNHKFLLFKTFHT